MTIRGFYTDKRGIVRPVVGRSRRRVVGERVVQQSGGLKGDVERGLKSLGSVRRKEVDGWTQYRINGDDVFLEAAFLGDDVWMYEIEVDKRLRGQGIGGRAVSVIVESTRRYGGKVHVHHPWNHEFWERMSEKYPEDLVLEL